MTCGIYLLKFNGTNKVYIGQSINIESRYKSHLVTLRANKSSRKLLDAYNEYGTPILDILLECDEHQLNENENLAIEIFNSVAAGFNTLDSAEEMPKWKNQLKGEDAPSAKYTNKQILDAVILMADPSKSLITISNITGVGYDALKKVYNGDNHMWILEEYPEHYQNMLNSKSKRLELNAVSRSAVLKDKFCAKQQGIVYPEVLSPTGETYNIDNLSEFCRVHNLQRTNFRKVLQGHRLSHKGWTVIK